MSLKMIARAALVAAAVIGSGTLAVARNGPVGDACKEDIAKFCPQAEHDGSIRACLVENYEKTSPACQAALDETGPIRSRDGQGNRQD